MRGFVRVASGAAIGVVCLSATAVADDNDASDRPDRPMMDPEREVQCAKDKSGDVWRLQCNESTKVCLYAPDDELDVDGDRAKPLERARPCPAFDKPFDRAALEAEGYRFVQGRPDAPWGWTRDDRGRVFQINFDLKKRLYVGASYSPKKVLDTPYQRTRSSIDFGLFIYEHWGGTSSPNRHRVRLVEGEVHLEPFTAEMTLIHYELSRRYVHPLLRITTFFGRPQRHDVNLNIGLWTEAGRMEVHQTDLGHSHLWRHGTANVTLDLWQSANLDSFARVRTGVGIEGQYTDVGGYRSAVTPGSAFELDTILDRSGFHNLRLEVAYEMPRYFAPLPNVGKRTHRMRTRLTYEAILIAINDQPLSLKFAAGGERRSDVPGVADEWAFVADAGLRFSLWAPPRPP